MTRRFLPVLLFAWSAFAGHAAEAAWLPIERQVAELTRSQDVTVVHFWAPWCSNCTAELTKEGWSSFLAANPKVKFIFVTSFHDEDGRAFLERYGLGRQTNFQLLLHPNASRKAEDKMTTFMDLPVAWIPSTWVFRDGKLCYALNYGEVRFPVLQQMVKDAMSTW